MLHFLGWPFRATCRVLKSRKFRRGGLIFVVVALLVFTPRSTRVLSPAHAAARGYEYGLVGWEVSNFLDKWVHRVREVIPWVGTSDEEKRERLDRYLALNDEIKTVKRDIDSEASASDPGSDQLTSLQDRLDELEKERSGLRNDVEELMESTIDAVLRDLGIGDLGPLTWPPVDFRLDSTPRVLVTSPRDRIKRLESILIDSDISLAERQTVEDAVYDTSGLSAIVLGTGGVATFPTVIPKDRDLLSTLDVAAHEWLHAYLIFKPLGRAYWNSGDLTTVNETVANLFGEEVGRLAYERITGETLPPPDPFIPETDPDSNEFSFRNFMRETRLKVDEILADGNVHGAEAYMEQRRIELHGHNIFIRKINQAYFAFNGSYGDNPASVSPIGEQVQELRTYVENVADLVKAIQGTTSYEGFIQRLEQERSASEERIGS
jgi:archaellum component FlaC